LIYTESRKIEYQINRLLRKANTLDDEELISDIAIYICVLVSGYIETSCRDSVKMYLYNRSDKTIRRHILKNLERFTNPYLDKVLDLIGSFDSDIKRNIERSIDDKVKEAVNSVVGQRHNIAHGRDSNISLVRITEYFNNIKTLTSSVQVKFR